MKVEFYSLPDFGKKKKVGEIKLLEDGTLEPVGDLALNVLTFPVLDPETHEVVTSRSDPKRFLELLHIEYQSPYTWATEPIQ